MNEVMRSVNYQSLGKLLTEIAASSAVQNTPELAVRVHEAIIFHQQLAGDVGPMLQEIQALRAQLSQATREPDERICPAPPANAFVRYERLRDAGLGTAAIYQAAKRDGLDDISTIRALRQTFNLSLREAQNVIAQHSQQAA